MRRFTLLLALVLLVLAAIPLTAQAEPAGDACWGQATMVFAQTGEMGEHASQFSTPRLGLRNLARALYEAEVIEDDTMQALGGFVVSELGLSVESCE